ncbi:nucleotidyltransferase family protein [Psychrobacter aestuarii]|uniref:Nucleotidyltransferase family protein n=1 Tax=Psychrobacter aestuarii TaxID=556327 RepID=A0ABP3FIM1_9GAMM|nr:NTP transferase domain-containing protein [Psychrobacter aestuarii]
MTHSDNKTTQTNAHAVILLAAGLSQRLGTPKQLLQQQGLPLITQMVQTAWASAPQHVIVVVPKALPDVARAAKCADIPSECLHIVTNDSSHLGMAHSLQLGIESVRTHAATCQRVLIMGVDQIHIDSAHLCALLGSASELAVSRYWADEYQTTRVLGLPVVVSGALLSVWSSQLAGDQGLRHLIRADNQDKAVIDNDDLMLDIDTPEQLAKASTAGWIDVR